MASPLPPEQETEMNTLSRLSHDDMNAIIRQAHDMRAAVIRDAILRVSQWFSRSLHRVTHAH